MPTRKRLKGKGPLLRLMPKVSCKPGLTPRVGHQWLKPARSRSECNRRCKGLCQRGRRSNRPTRQRFVNSNRDRKRDRLTEDDQTDRPDIGVTETIRRATTRRVRQDRPHLLLLYRYRLLLLLPEADQAAAVAAAVVMEDQVDRLYHQDQGGSLTGMRKRPHLIN